ncbi:hypothetical protein [Pseudactinotalea terrae]|uniref:hypothetical protein n=1 Tax=Pseudactinotalea terrae TaxID=1743262 RepID=UPI0012E2E59E|nr:hypothetical protein [Pseudactinotalea terrae]
MTATLPRRVPAGITTGGQFTAHRRAEASVVLPGAGRVATLPAPPSPETLVRVEDPEDVWSPPLYRGPASGAAAVLAAGAYIAVDAADAFTEYAIRIG